MNFWNILLIIGLAQGFYLIVSLLVFNKSNVLPNKYLSLLIFALSSIIAFELLNDLENYHYRIILRIVSISSSLLIGPSLYFFFKHSFKLNYKSTRRHLSHFAPFFILVIFLTLIELVSNSISAADLSSSLPIYVSIIELLKTIHLGVYILFSYKLIINLTRSKKSVIYYGSTKKILLWFKILLLLIIFAMILSLIYFVSIKYFDIEVQFGSPKVIALILVVLIYSIAFMGIQFPIIVLSESDSLIIKRSPKYKTSSLGQEDIDSWLLILKIYMEKEKPFLNDELKIESLANEVNIPTHHLSQIVNQGFEKSFQDFINHYRVEEFKMKIINPNTSNKTILAIAHESGFSSKSSFNRVFKSYTGITPYEYKKANSTNESQIRK